LAEKVTVVVDILTKQQRVIFIGHPVELLHAVTDYNSTSRVNTTFGHTTACNTVWKENKVEYWPNVHILWVYVYMRD